MRACIPTVLSALLCFTQMAEASQRHTTEKEKADSIATYNLTEVSITASPKETAPLRQQALSSTELDKEQLKAHGVMALKGAGTLVPNFFMPDYGSRQTSAVYIRGIGSRIGTPAIGLYVDNVPYYDKAAFDFSFFDIESLSVLRGPQSTLYGRNTMGGMVRVQTRNPFSYEGTDINLGYSTGDNRRHASVTHYHRISDKFAFSAGGYYDGSSGFFQNDLTGKNVDASQAGGGRMRAIYIPTDRLTLDATLHYEYTNEGAYPYFYTGATSGSEEYEDMKGLISANLEGKYRRSLLNFGLHTKYRFPTLTLHSVTAYQHIGDRMFMDQDFLQADIYSLEQKQNINIFSEELTLKGFRHGNAQGVLGMNFFYQWQDIKAPVNFRKDGVQWLNNTINSAANRFMPQVQSGPMTMDFIFSDHIQGENLAFQDDFSTPSMGVALFHQSTFSQLFGIDGLSADAGLRLDYEHVSMNYNAWYDFTHTYSLSGHLTMPNMDRNIAMVPQKEYSVSNHSLNGKLSEDYLQLLPRLALKYTFHEGNVYASASRGFRSGGYNAQNISELLRAQMQTDMMRDVRDATLPVLQAQPMVPADTKNQVSGILNSMAQASTPDVAGSCNYAPEYAWNYEVGTHLKWNRFSIDLTTFLSDIKDLQLSQMSQTGLGRIIVNAGKIRSAGVEATLKAEPIEHLQLMGNYGYTHSTFTDYQIDGTDCKGNFVPYMPQHTFNADIAYTFTKKSHTSIYLRGGQEKKPWGLTIGVGCNGAGNIYWDEQNLHRQTFYALLSARIGVEFQKFDVQFWGRNLTDTKYNTFWFQTMNRGFEQHGKSLQLGISAHLHL